jgi:hypothetical protein
MSFKLSINGLAVECDTAEDVIRLVQLQTEGVEKVKPELRCPKCGSTDWTRPSDLTGHVKACDGVQRNAVERHHKRMAEWRRKQKADKVAKTQREAETVMMLEADLEREESKPQKKMAPCRFHCGKEFREGSHWKEKHEEECGSAIPLPETAPLARRPIA